MSVKETYLGDGLYASYNGSQIKVRTDRSNGPHWIYLDQDSLDALLAYVEKIKKEVAGEK